MTKTRWLKWFSAGATTLLLSVFVMPIALGGSAGRDAALTALAAADNDGNRAGRATPSPSG